MKKKAWELTIKIDNLGSSEDWRGLRTGRAIASGTGAEGINYGNN